jgi:hypothetical protein
VAPSTRRDLVYDEPGVGRHPRRRCSVTAGWNGLRHRPLGRSPGPATRRVAHSSRALSWELHLDEVGVLDLGIGRPGVRKRAERRGQVERAVLRRVRVLHLIEQAPQRRAGSTAPGRTPGGRERIWLPFEGDGTLSLILSKAVLLSNDAAITDPKSY